MVAPFLKQAWAVSAVLLNMVGQGMLLSFSSCLLPGLREPDSPIKPDLQTASWISSSIGVAGIPGFITSSLVMSIWGRRVSHGLIILPGIFGWTLLYFATNIPMLLIGRIFGGMTAGGTVSLGAVVIGEYTSPEHRGMFLNLKTASVCLGSMLVHIFGNFYTWRTIALIALVPHIMAVLIIMTWPESPAWLASINEIEKCENAFYWLRGKSEESVRELEELIKAQTNQRMKLKENSTTSFQVKVSRLLKKFTRKDFLLPVSIITLGAILLEVSGRHFFPAYALDIIGEISGNKSSSFYYTLAIDIIITASATFSSILVTSVKRRTLLFGTGIAALVMLAIVCTYLFLVSLEVISKDYPLLPISMFVAYFILVNLGCTPIPLSFLGELLPLEHRAMGSLIGGIVLSVCVNVGLLIPSILLASVKVHGTFAVLGVAMGIILLILYFILPETKDRTLQEIEDYFNNGRYRDDERNADEEDVKKKMIGNDYKNSA